MNPSAPRALADQLAAERAAKQREYVLANTRARWRFVGIGVLLLCGVRLAGLVPIPWLLIAAFTAAFAAANHAMARLGRETAFRPWYAHLNVGLGAPLISAVVLRWGAPGHGRLAAPL